MTLCLHGPNSQLYKPQKGVLPTARAHMPGAGWAMLLGMRLSRGGMLDGCLSHLECESTATSLASF